MSPRGEIAVPMLLRSAAEANFVKIGGDFSKTILLERRGKAIKAQRCEVACDERSLEGKIGSVGLGPLTPGAHAASASPSKPTTSRASRWHEDERLTFDAEPN
jgi:hypothetical protein